MNAMLLSSFNFHLHYNLHQLLKSRDRLRPVARKIIMLLSIIFNLSCDNQSIRIFLFDPRDTFYPTGFIVFELVLIINVAELLLT